MPYLNHIANARINKPHAARVTALKDATALSETTLKEEVHERSIIRRNGDSVLLCRASSGYCRTDTGSKSGIIEISSKNKWLELLERGLKNGER